MSNSKGSFFNQTNIRRFFSVFLIELMLSLLSCRAFAEVGISIGSGTGVRDIVPIRVSIQKDFKICCGCHREVMLSGYWEGSYYYLHGKKPYPIFNDRLYAFAIAPVFRFQKKDCCNLWPYLDIGFGLSWFSKKEICGRNLSLHFEFEDRAALGFRFGRNHEFDLSYKFIHFSNAYLGATNNGINLHVVALGYWF